MLDHLLVYNYIYGLYKLTCSTDYKLHVIYIEESYF